MATKKWYQVILDFLIAVFKEKTTDTSTTNTTTDTTTPPSDTTGSPSTFDLAKVKWVHGGGANIAAWPVLCGLEAVRFDLPYVVTTGATWPIEWPTVGAKKVQASHIVIAQINGEWYGGCWEALRLGISDRRPLEGLTKVQKNPNYGPFCQVERDPFWYWHPKPGEKIGFMITSWVRSSVAQPVGRSKEVWCRWPG